MGICLISYVVSYTLSIVLTFHATPDVSILDLFMTEVNALCEEFLANV